MKLIPSKELFFAFTLENLSYITPSLTKSLPDPYTHALSLTLLRSLSLSLGFVFLRSGIFLAMGKRKAKTKPPPKKRMDKLDTVFSCPFCNHGSSVECRIDMKNLIGEASCGICQESFSTTITALSEAIDIYSEWIDECERVNTLEDE
ncbi:hypothetical protein RIF29_41298 [Crotalaria pallida]|uniref:Transcription elongation factor 1 homolog n=1 Tax=Crotalaria pallida TaxID=3830 RepID=A0AAN9EAA1_CROPI